MYEYQRTAPRRGIIVPSNPNVFASRSAIRPQSMPYSTHLQGQPIDNCALGGCAPRQMGIADTTAHRPWWHYVAAGLGVGVGYYLLRNRMGFMRNPEEHVIARDVPKHAAAIAIQAGIPVILWGPPGVGKTQWVKALGKSMAFMNNGEPVEVVTVIGSTKDPTDIGGMPTIKGGTNPPRWAARLMKRSKEGKKSILFLDEFSSMSPMVHAALLRVVNEKVAGEHEFDPTGDMVHVIAAANPKKLGAGSRDLPPPAANRMIHIDWPPVSGFEWAVGVTTGKWPEAFFYKIPRDWESDPIYDETKKDIYAFMQANKQGKYLFEMPRKAARDREGNTLRGRAWPSPRSWEMAVRTLTAARIAKAPIAVQKAVVAGAIGDHEKQALLEEGDQGTEKTKPGLTTQLFDFLKMYKARQRGKGAERELLEEEMRDQEALEEFYRFVQGEDSEMISDEEEAE